MISPAADWRQLTRDLIHRTERELRTVLDGLPAHRLDRPATAGTNTIGWLLWHLTRSHDRNVSELRGRPQLWVRDGWHARFGRAADPADTGYRHTPGQAAAFRSPAPQVLAGYHRAVVGMIDRYLDTAPVDDPARRADSPTLGDSATVHERLVGVLVDGLQHVGQAALLRGVLERSEASSRR